MHRAAGGFGALNVYQRSVIAVPYAKPAGDFSLLIGDWYKANHKVSVISICIYCHVLIFVYRKEDSIP